MIRLAFVFITKILNHSLIVCDILRSHLFHKDHNSEKSIRGVIYDREVAAYSTATRGILAYRNAATDHKRGL